MTGGIHELAGLPDRKRIVHCKRAPYDVYIGRPSKWGNPFTVNQDGTRAEVIARYERWLVDQGDLLAAIGRGELTGKVLGCWCAPKPCHGDVLAQLADIADADRSRLA